MIEDSILQEVRAAREAFAREHGYDLRSMVDYLRRQDERGDWPVVRLAPRRCKPTIELESSEAEAVERLATSRGVADVDLIHQWIQEKIASS